MDERTENRMTSDAVVICTREGKRSKHRCNNLSRKGCMIVVDDSSVAPGDAIEIELIAGVIATGKVVWQRSGSAGVAFDSKLHEAAVRYLAVIDQAPFANAPMTDRFGRPLPDIYRSDAA